MGLKPNIQVVRYTIDVFEKLLNYTIQTDLFFYNYQEKNNIIRQL